MSFLGDVNSQGKRAAILVMILSRKEDITLVEQPSMEHVGTKVANNVLQSIGIGLG